MCTVSDSAIEMSGLYINISVNRCKCNFCGDFISFYLIDLYSVSLIAHANNQCIVPINTMVLNAIEA